MLTLKEISMTDTVRPDTPRGRGDHDAPHMSPVTPAEDARTIMINQISWGAVLAGVVRGLAGNPPLRDATDRTPRTHHDAARGV